MDALRGFFTPGGNGKGKGRAAAPAASAPSPARSLFGNNSFSIGDQSMVSQGGTRRKRIRYSLGPSISTSARPFATPDRGGFGSTFGFGAGRSTAAVTPATAAATTTPSQPAPSIPESTPTSSDTMAPPRPKRRAPTLPAVHPGERSAYESFDEETWLKSLGWQIKKALSKPVSVAPTPARPLHTSVLSHASPSPLTPKGKKRAYDEVQQDATTPLPADSPMANVSAEALPATEVEPRQYGFYKTAVVQTDPEPEPVIPVLQQQTLVRPASDGIILYPGQASQAAERERQEQAAQAEAAQERAAKAARAVQEMLMGGGVDAEGEQLSLAQSFQPVGLKKRQEDASEGEDDDNDDDEEDEEDEEGKPSDLLSRFALPNGNLDIEALLGERQRLQETQQEDEREEQEDEENTHLSQAPKKPLIQVSCKCADLQWRCELTVSHLAGA